MKTVVALGHDAMGDGAKELGERILRTFLQKTPALRTLDAIVLFNGGVKLVTTNSPVLVELRQLHDNGVDVLPCGTCVDYYGLREEVAVGEVSNMDAIVATLDAAEKVITL